MSSIQLALGGGEDRVDGIRLGGKQEGDGRREGTNIVVIKPDIAQKPQASYDFRVRGVLPMSFLRLTWVATVMWNEIRTGLTAN